MESTGRIQPDSRGFLIDQFDATADKLCMSKVTIHRYWIRHLSCSLQRSLANAIIKRSYNLTADRTRVPTNNGTLENLAEEVVNHEYHR